MVGPQGSWCTHCHSQLLPRSHNQQKIRNVAFTEEIACIGNIGEHCLKCHQIQYTPTKSYNVTILPESTENALLRQCTFTDLIHSWQNFFFVSSHHLTFFLGHFKLGY